MAGPRAAHLSCLACTAHHLATHHSATPAFRRVQGVGIVVEAMRRSDRAVSLRSRWEPPLSSGPTWESETGLGRITPGRPPPSLTARENSRRAAAGSAPSGDGTWRWAHLCR
jgi:hypothetical protein